MKEKYFLQSVSLRYADTLYKWKRNFTLDTDASKLKCFGLSFNAE